MKRNSLVVTALLGLSVLFGGYATSAAAAGHTTATGEEKVLSGTVEIDATQLAFIVSGKFGGGVLKFQGKEYAFKGGGLGIGGIGVQKIKATGKVYNLTDVSKFPGTYVAARAGATLGKGKNVISVSNQHGVIIDLKASTEGVALSIGADGLVVKMK